MRHLFTAIALTLALCGCAQSSPDPSILQVARLNGESPGDHFGRSVAIQGNLLAIGAQGFPAGGDQGAVYLYLLNGNAAPELVGRICNGCTGERDIDVPLAEDDWFGVSVAIDGRRLIVGAWGDDGFGEDVIAENWGQTRSEGAVYLFTFAGDEWQGGRHAGTIGRGYTGEFDIDVAIDDVAFGWDLDLEGNQLVSRSSYDSERRGAAYMFEFSDTEFSDGRLIGVIGHDRHAAGDVNVDLEPDDAFAHALDMQRGVLLIGADKDDGAGNVGSMFGALYAYRYSAGLRDVTPLWIAGEGYTGGANIAVDLDDNDFFGLQAEMDGRWFAVGASGDDGADNVSSGAGAVRLFECADEMLSSCVLRSTIGLGYTGDRDVSVELGRFDYFSYSLALNEGRLAVGSPFAPWGDSGDRCTECNGNVRIFTTR